jgi:hypothetical protein
MQSKGKMHLVIVILQTAKQAMHQLRFQMKLIHFAQA